MRFSKIIFFVYVYMVIYFNDKEYKTKKAFKEYIQNLIKNEIGLCDSLKSTKYWNEILKLMSRHPEFDDKTKDLKDVMIRNSMYGNIELCIINNDDTLTTFSYLTAIDAKGNSPKCELSSACREAIQYQINNYRYNNHLECVNCGELENIEIDHIIPFCKIRDDFLTIWKNQGNKIPISFDRDLNIRRKFKEEDKQFYTNWIYYHQVNAELQCLCRPCNRKKSNQM